MKIDTLTFEQFLSYKPLAKEMLSQREDCLKSLIWDYCLVKYGTETAAETAMKDYISKLFERFGS